MSSIIGHGVAMGTAMPLAIVVGTAVLIYAIYLRALPKPLPGIPYNQDSAKRLLGDIPYFTALVEAGTKPSLFWAQNAQRHNSPLTQYFMGPFSKPHVIIADFRESRELISKRSKDLGRGQMNNDGWSGVIPAHFIAMEDSNPSFKPARSLTKDLMTPSFLNDISAPASYNKVSSFVELWKLKALTAKGSPFEASDDLEFLTYDIMMAAAFGTHDSDSETVRHLNHLRSANLSNGSHQDVNQIIPFPTFEKPALFRALHTITGAVTSAFVQPSPKLFHKFNNLRPTMRDAYKSKETTIQSYIDGASQRLMENGSTFKPSSAVDYMVHREASAAKKEGREPVFNSLRFTDMLFGYLTGGQDSTHSTLSFMAKQLGAHQEEQSKLRASLHLAHQKARDENRQPSIEEINKIQVPYLDAFIEETLRLNSPASGVIKEALQDMTVLNHSIPKGTPLVFLFSGPTFSDPGLTIPEKHRSEGSQVLATDRLEDWGLSDYAPNEFHPERWLHTEDNGELVFSNNAGPFLSFSGGPRGCWGKRLAYLELRLMITLFVWELEFEKLPPGLENWDLIEGLFAKPKTCLVRIKSTTSAKN